MKNLIVFSISMLLFWSLPMMAFCQALTPDVPVVDVFNFQSYFISISALATLIVPVTGFINQKLLHLKGTWKQVLSWVVALGLGALAWWLKWGIFDGILWYWALAYALLSGLVANGIFNVPIVKTILQILKIEVKVE